MARMSTSQISLLNVVQSSSSGKDRDIPLADAAELLRTGLFAKHDGLFPGKHYRMEDGEGCIHLRVHGDKAFIHRDQYDPRRFPLEHMWESPLLRWVSVVLLAVALGIGYWFVKYCRPGMQMHGP